MSKITIIISPDGSKFKGIYSDDFDYSMLGNYSTRRASHVEPGEDNKWYADMSPMGAGVLGPFDKRSDALAAEVALLDCLLK